MSTVNTRTAREVIASDASGNPVTIVVGQPGQFSRYDVEPFSGARYHENEKRVKAGNYPCGICGREVKNAKHFGIVINGGCAWGDESSPVDAGHMGEWSIGNDCHKKHAVVR